MEYGNHHHRHAVPRIEDDCSERSRPIRWSPKEEQVEILESIYNSGVINPPKDETTRITTLLQYYGPVVDANVFYWFQNRRSRSRRRHRQIMAAAAAANIINSREDEDQEQILIGQDQQPPPPAGSPNYYYTTTGQHLSQYPTPNNSGEQNLLSPSITFLHDDSAAAYSSSSSTPAINENICCSNPAQVCNLDIQRNSDQVSPDVAYTTCPGAGYALNVHYDQSAAGFISVYINGAATVVPMGPLDMKRMFGEQDFILIHSTSGMLVSNTSISSSLAHGESYFLVPAST